MPFRPTDRLKFEIERRILRSPLDRLFVIALFIVVISVIAGWLAWRFTPGFGAVEEAFWWAFLRLTDPGYLGDDEGTLLRTISTIVTILGYVIFLGALIAIMTQWLNQTLHRLQLGLTPIAENDHILILGWTNRTATIIEELLLSEGRLRRFLLRHSTRRLRLVILVEDLSPQILQSLRERLGPLWKERQIIFRSGTPLRLEHLERVDFLRASVIILPTNDFADESEDRDAKTIKTLLSISSSAEEENAPLPLMVAEVVDAQKVALAERAYQGPIEILAGDLLISRMIAQNVRHEGLSPLYRELLTHSEGSEIYARDVPKLSGRNVRVLRAVFPRALLLGIVRRNGFIPLFDRDELILEDEDRLVMIAGSFEDTLPREMIPSAFERIRQDRKPLSRQRSRRVLILGWNHRAPALIAEFDSYLSESFSLDIASRLSIAERETQVLRRGVEPKRATVRHIEADYTSARELKALAPGEYDNIIILASQMTDSEEESDARTVVGFLILEEALAASGASRPHVLVELMDPDNVRFLHDRAEVIVSPLLLSHMLTQVALRPELGAVFDEIFGPNGVEIFLRPATDFAMTGERISFAELGTRADASQEIALGYRSTLGSIELNPPGETTWTVAPDDQIVVLTRY